MDVVGGADGGWALRRRLVSVVAVTMLAAMPLLATPSPASGQTGVQTDAQAGPQEQTTAADDHHAGYYYPAVTSTEIYHARVETLADSDRNRRIGFVTGVTAGQTERPYPPTTALFAKGSEAEKRSEERRVGKECVRTWRTLGSEAHSKKKK